MDQMLKRIAQTGLIPVIKIDRAEDAVPLAKALMDGGLPAAEITFRTACAKEAISAITKAYPDMLVGAGTVLTTEQVDEAAEAGAQFIVSPGFNRKTVEYCLGKGIAVIPGCSSPSDVEQAIECGLAVVKFFPAEAAGGLAMIKALSAPFPALRFMPTGGINEKNLNEYLRYPKVLACGGSFMVDAKAIAEGDFAKITALTKKAVQQMLGFKVTHIGINAGNATEAETASQSFAELFGFPEKAGNSSIFVSPEIEIMKSAGRGANGHIAIGTCNAERAYAYLKGRGVEFIEDSARYDDKGKLHLIYLKDSIAGFAVHLVEE